MNIKYFLKAFHSYILSKYLKCCCLTNYDMYYDLISNFYNIMLFIYWQGLRQAQKYAYSFINKDSDFK